ncbi:MAG: SDR family oxidoreductase [Rhodobacteraceae bacterium]|nr:SDR family oxidoreductase [Pseudooceanicola sp. HF7]NVK35679.1 SDR family oxidoreductase [Paracoccaceae bacterium]
MAAPAAMDVQTAVITGAARGVGAEIARALHGAGFRVLLTDVDEPGCQALAAELDPALDMARAETLDVGKPEDFQRVLDKAVAEIGAVQVLVNNAALTKAQPVLDITPQEFNAIMAVNAGGTFAGSQIFARHFKDMGYGRIVNMASLAGQNGGTATGAHYAASKGAIMTLTKVFARDLAPFGITCNCISPGPMDSPMVHDIVGADRMEGFLKNIPVGDLGDPKFVAQLVALLASPAASFVTGACWDVNGGLFMR